jgi:DNA repair exonuclease SbcCD ATPase subunit/DNA repair exonuclease SbcCD nuclease subunit
MKIIHLSDIHWRGLSRHDEYRETFLNFFNKAKKMEPDVIYIGGDIVHSKTQGISPELIDSLCWWFTELAKIADTHVILGNHDGLLLNKQRQDAITPILRALDNPRIHLHKESGVYPIGTTGVNWCNFSCFDEDGWKDVKPIEGDINIALFHGAVWGSKTDVDWDISGDVKVNFFDGYDFALLGDIHKEQTLAERWSYREVDKNNLEKYRVKGWEVVSDAIHAKVKIRKKKGWIKYSGSAIQQNYGESPGKGFLFWDIRSRDDFDVTFHEIEHSTPFITIDWHGTVENTIENAKDVPSGARFRVKSDAYLQQADMKLLGVRLKTTKDACEVVYKVDQRAIALDEKSRSQVSYKKNIRDSSLLKEMMRTYHENSGLTKKEWKKFDDLVTSVASQACSVDNSSRNSRWSIRKIEFDNTFGFGKNNVIDFDKLDGITGIFGKNRSGKSSIIGTLMYVFFNTTDRGPIKNVHIVNSRKEYCRVTAYFTVNNLSYKVERFTIKNQAKDGRINAPTGLNLFKTDIDGNVIEDLTGEQRRETEKTLRALIGTHVDFLLTSLAPQGDMNTFIKERASERKRILSKFLDLDIFDKMHEFAKDASSPHKALVKSAPEIDYALEIKRIREQVRRKKKKIGTLAAIIERDRILMQDFNVQLATTPNKGVVSRDELNNQIEHVDEIDKKIAKEKSKLKEDIEKINSLKTKIKKTEQLIIDFPIDEIRNKIEECIKIEKDLVNIEHSHISQKQTLVRQQKSIDILNTVPCGDMFLTCKFIKNSHKNKKKIDEQKKLVKVLGKQVSTTKRAISVLKNRDLDGQKRKYDALIKRVNEIKVTVSKQEIFIHEIETKLSSLEKVKIKESSLLTQMEISVVDDIEPDDVFFKLKKKIKELGTKIHEKDSERISIAESIGRGEIHIDSLKADKKKYENLSDDLKLYDMLIQGVSKNGIPKQIISSQLPVINAEITKILQTITGFTVELEDDPNTNAMDIFINYGDSKRVIELGSGMEKMMSSLAIRVALINVSSLPKTDILLIDEGFGTLDETNIEACNSLLISLKKWFKNIIIISHVDAVKDVVDDVIDISLNGKNSFVKYD